MVYFGIDPGKSGSISAVWDDGEPYSVSQSLADTEADVVGFILGFDLERARAVIERVHSTPQMGVKSAFTFGQSYGFLRGLLTAHKIPYAEVAPSKWQQAMGCRTAGDKNVSKAKAQQLFPHLKVTHRNADSLLLAEYARIIDDRSK